MRPDQGVQRGSVMDMPFYSGDPLTPGWAAEKGAKRLSRSDAKVLMTIPHLAFEVDDLAAALEGKEILVAPNSPSAGVKVAMILDDGAPVELLEFAAEAKVT